MERTVTDFKPARMRDGSFYSGNRQYIGNGVLRSCGRCYTHQPTFGFRKTKYGMTCARCQESMKEKA